MITTHIFDHLRQIFRYCICTQGKGTALSLLFYVLVTKNEHNSYSYMGVKQPLDCSWVVLITSDDKCYIWAYVLFWFTILFPIQWVINKKTNYGWSCIWFGGFCEFDSRSIHCNKVCQWFSPPIKLTATSETLLKVEFNTDLEGVSQIVLLKIWLPTWPYTRMSSVLPNKKKRSNMIFLS